LYKNNFIWIKKINDIDFIKGGKIVVTGHFDKSVRLWDVGSGNSVQEAIVHSAQVTSVSISPDGNYILSNSRDNTLKLLDLRYNNELEVTSIYRSDNYRNGLDWNSACFSTDGTFIAAGGADGSIVIWNTKTTKQEIVLQSIKTPVSSCAWSPTGHLLAVSYQDKNVQLWGE